MTVPDDLLYSAPIISPVSAAVKNASTTLARHTCPFAEKAVLFCVSCLQESGFMVEYRKAAETISEIHS